MTVYFRLLAGFTSFMWALCSVHLCSRGPVGIFAVLASMIMKVSSLLAGGALELRLRWRRGPEAGEHGDGEGDVHDGDEGGHDRRRLLHLLGVERVRHAERTEHRVHPVPEVEAERRHGDDV